MNKKKERAWVCSKITGEWLTGISLVFALSCFIMVAEQVFVAHNVVFDQKVFAFMAAHTTASHTWLMEFFTVLGTSTFLFMANLLLIGYFVFVRRKHDLAVIIPVTTITSGLLMLGLKELFGRMRPDHPLIAPPGGFSFPSGHALVSTAFYGLLVWITWHRVRSPFKKWLLIPMLVMLILCIGISRIYLRVHYASDVLAGFSLGFFWLVVSLRIFGFVDESRRRKQNKVEDGR